MPLKIGPKEFTKEQTIFLAVIGGVLLIFLLVVFGTIPGRKGGNPNVDLVVWGAGDDAQTWNNRGVCLQRMGQVTDAKECFERALQVDPEDSDAKFNLAQS